MPVEQLKVLYAAQNGDVWAGTIPARGACAAAGFGILPANAGCPVIAYRQFRATTDL